MNRLMTLFTLVLLGAFHGESMAQNKITIKGVVKDRTLTTVKAGVTISMGKPPKSIGATSQNGSFSVTVPAGTELIFSHAGMTTVKKKVTASTNDLVIVMVEKNDPMQEVVVQGFKTKTRETSTGSTTIVTGKTLQDVPVSNVIELLQGKVAGLNVQNNTGSPGAMGTINLRGISSASVSSDGYLTPTSPLFVIDGVPVDVNTSYEYGFQSGGPGINPISLIPPEDIEQMEVLKDAAAASLYGSRAVYGVILITTKRGQSKVPIVQYASSFFVKTSPRLREIEGGKEERLKRIRSILRYDTSEAAAKALVNQLAFLSDSLNPYYNNSTDWQDYYFRSTYNQQHNVSILGGDQRFNYKTNLNYYQENGIVKNTGFKRYSLSMNALYQPTNAFKMLVNLTGSLGQKQNGSGNGLVQTGVASGPSTSSLLPPPSLFSENNSTLAAASVRDDNKTSNILTSLDLQYEPIKGLRFGNLLSYNYISGTADKFTPSFLNNGSSISYSYNDRTYTLYNRSLITFTKTVRDVHNVSTYVFNEINSYGFRANAIQLTQTPGDQIEGPIGYNWTRSSGGTLNNTRDTRQHGYGASFSYNYDKKYVIDLSYRLDGLSTNGPTQGYTRNPTVSARWNFGRENWFEKTAWLSYGSIRGSWGRNIKPTGNIFDVFGKYVAGSRYNNNPTVTIDFSTVPNDDFQPEIQNSSNIGLEMGLWNNALEVTLEGYYRSIDNQIVDVDLANINGFAKVKSNAISMVNYGFEYSVTARLLKQSKKVQWTLTASGGFNRDVLTRLPGGLRQHVTTTNEQGVQVPVVRRIGRNALSNLLFLTQGVYGSTADVPVNKSNGQLQKLGAGSGFYFQGGDPRWTDVNGDYVIDNADLLPLGNPVPRITGGIFSNTSYKNFQLNVQVSYTLFRDLLNNAMSQQFQYYTNPADPAVKGLLPIDKFDYWKPVDGSKDQGSPNAQYPNPFDFRRAGTLQPFRSNQTLFLEEGSYWKINNIVLAYNFNRKMIAALGMTSCRLTLTANNVYTFSNYSGPDPELVTQLGRDNSGGYPTARSYALGISIQF